MISISIIYYFIQKNNDRPNPASQQTNCASGGSPRFPVAGSLGVTPTGNTTGRTGTTGERTALGETMRNEKNVTENHGETWGNQKKTLRK